MTNKIKIKKGSATMATWLAPKKAAQHIREHNPETMISERSIRDLIRKGFPHLKINTRSLINVDSFDDDLTAHVKKISEQQNPPATVGGIRKIAG